MKMRMNLLKGDWYGVELRIAFCFLLKMYIGPQFCHDTKVPHGRPFIRDLEGRVSAGQTPLLVGNKEGQSWPWWEDSSGD